MNKNQLIDEYHNDTFYTAKTKFADGKEKYGNSWYDSHPDYMWRRMEEELYEFRQAVEHDESAGEALRELADVVNYGLMCLALHEKGMG